MQQPASAVIIDIDGLRRDVFQACLAEGSLPHIARLLNANAVHVEAVSTAPSITFAAQASIVTGCHPGAHGVAGNEIFDRRGRLSAGKPRHFGFDVGDTLSVDDAVAVFADGLAARFLCPDTPTLYERAAARGLTSTVAYHMYARGATHWLPPNIMDIARFTKGRGVLGLEAGQYDAGMLKQLIQHLDAGHSPDLLMAYFMGLDHHSHQHGPASQPEYLRQVIDPQIGELVAALERQGMLENALFAFVSDHGQIEAIPDDRHSLRLGFPFDMELSHVFKALRLDVHDTPGEAPACDAVMGLNGGLAHVYLQRRDGRWADRPRYREDILPVAAAFDAMNTEGRYEPDLQGTLEMILVRNTERDGWQGDYRVYLPSGETQALRDYLGARPELEFVDAVNRLQRAASDNTGDLILIAKGREGYYFGAPLKGVHGGLLPGESETVLTFAYPGADEAGGDWLHKTIHDQIADRCAAEGQRRPSIADLAPVVGTLLGWDA